jgi:UDP-N-acetylmuramoyl-L-alanyl-D-glutamate--2,6-diaminopimelate ligase
MRLSELIAGTGGQAHNFLDVDVRGLEFDSRQVTAGEAFIALTGDKYDGHDFIPAAIKQGAVALFTGRRMENNLPQVVYADTRDAMGRLARNFFGGFDDIQKVGITGTNGKTTTAFLIHSISRTAGRKPGLIGTIYYMGRERVKAARTTPESLDIFKLFQRFHDEGSRDVIMEVSSHALALKRVDQIRFQVALFTNLSQDHLDFHKTMDDYQQAKFHLFSLLGPEAWVVYNTDDPVGAELKARSFKKQIPFSMLSTGPYSARVREHSLDGLIMDVTGPDREYQVKSRLVGEYNGYNILAAFCAGLALGIAAETVVCGIESLTSIRGRLECAAPSVFVDFAHTPRALEHVLKTLRRYARGRTIAVFGCGGDRDPGKRPLMGRAVSRNADYAYVTSDNPRSESPRAIIRDIEAGMEGDRYRVVEDRREAIAEALKSKKPDDILIILGKGHEEEQVLRDRTIEFDDVKVVRELLENIK